jgi:hypothetical protein
MARSSALSRSNSLGLPAIFLILRKSQGGILAATVMLSCIRFAKAAVLA